MFAKVKAFRTHCLRVNEAWINDCPDKPRALNLPVLKKCSFLDLLSSFVYFGAGKTHLAVFIQKCEIVEDVSAEHDVLARVDSQHHWHLDKN